MSEITGMHDPWLHVTFGAGIARKGLGPRWTPVSCHIVCLKCPKWHRNPWAMLVAGFWGSLFSSFGSGLDFFFFVKDRR